MNTYYELACAWCKADNLVDNGDTSDMTVPDVDSFKCWKCGRVSHMPGYDGGDATKGESFEEYDVDGEKPSGA